MTDKKQNIVTVISGIIARIEADPRFKYKPADVSINAPLALIQVDMTAKHSQAKALLPLALNQQVIIHDLIASMEYLISLKTIQGITDKEANKAISQAKIIITRAKTKS